MTPIDIYTEKKPDELEKLTTMSTDYTNYLEMNTK